MKSKRNIKKEMNKFVKKNYSKSIKNILLDLLTDLKIFIQINETKKYIDLKKMGEEYYSLSDTINHLFNYIDSLDDNYPYLSVLKKDEFIPIYYNIDCNLNDCLKFEDNLLLTNSQKEICCNTLNSIKRTISLFKTYFDI